MLSIALSMVVVNCIVMLVQGYDFESYQNIFLASDFQLDQMTDTLSNTNFNGITPEIKEILNKCPESEKTGYVFYSEERHKMEPALLKTWETLAEKNNEITTRVHEERKHNISFFSIPAQFPLNVFYLRSSYAYLTAEQYHNGTTC